MPWTTGAAARHRRPASTTACARCASSTRPMRSRVGPARGSAGGLGALTIRRAVVSDRLATTRRDRRCCESRRELLLGRDPEPVLQDEPHLLHGRAPELATGIRFPDLLAHLVHRRVRLLL